MVHENLFDTIYIYVHLVTNYFAISLKVFTPESMIMYLRVFNFLWRAKRMEYILAGVWKGQMANARLLRAVPGIHFVKFIAQKLLHNIQFSVMKMVISR